MKANTARQTGLVRMSRNFSRKWPSISQPTSSSEPRTVTAVVDSGRQKARSSSSQPFTRPARSRIVLNAATPRSQSVNCRR